MTEINVRQRMAELMKPIDRQIMMCDNDNELLMLASAMLSSAKHIYELQLGKEGVKTLFMESLKNGEH